MMYGGNGVGQWSRWEAELVNTLYAAWCHGSERPEWRAHGVSQARPRETHEYSSRVTDRELASKSWRQAPCKTTTDQRLRQLVQRSRTDRKLRRSFFHYFPLALSTPRTTTRIALVGAVGSWWLVYCFATSQIRSSKSNCSPCFKYSLSDARASSVLECPEDIDAIERV